MPNAGLPQLTADGAHYPLTPVELADALEQFVGEFGLGLVGGCCGTDAGAPAPGGRAAGRTGPRCRARRRHVAGRRRRSTPRCRSGRTPATSRSASGPTPTARKAFREALLEERWDDCVEIARAQIRDGAHLLDLNIDYVGRDGAADMRALASRFATASTLPIVLDSTEPAVLQAGLEALGRPGGDQLGQLRGRRRARTRGSREIMPLVVEHGAAVIALTIDEEGQARTADWKVAVAERLIDDLTGNWGMRTSDIIIDCLTFPIATGQEETRRDGIETIEAIREVKRRYPGGADHAGPVQHLLRAQPGRPGGAQLGLPARVHRGRAGLGDRARGQDRADGADPRRAARGRARHGLRPAPARATTRCSGSSSSSRASPPPTPRPSGPRSWPRCR